MLPTQTDVLIVGAGPTGLALAIALQQAGVDHLLIDRLPQGQNTSRAAVIHAHTLEMLAPLGVTEALTARGLKLTRFTIRDRDRPLLQLRFDGLPSPHHLHPDAAAGRHRARPRRPPRRARRHHPPRRHRDRGDARTRTARG